MSARCLSHLLRPSLVGRLFAPRLAPAGRTVLSLSVSTGSHVNVSMDDKTGVATMRMDRKPVNSLSLEMLTELVVTLEKLENEKACRGLIITSALPKIFSAGLDIMEMYQPQEARLREFWRAAQELWLRFYSCRLPVMAAINGHSPAGGCLLALCADYRIMAEGKYTIGLNETLLGIVAPFWFKDTFVYTIGLREAERSLQLGLLYSPEEALRVGLVDCLAPESEVVAAAGQEIMKWLQIPDIARQLTKTSLRQPVVDRLVSQRESDIDNFVNFITRDGIQKGLGMYLESLKKKV